MSYAKLYFFILILYDPTYQVDIFFIENSRCATLKSDVSLKKLSLRSRVIGILNIFITPPSDYIF
jgi:hypothetical protein